MAFFAMTPLIEIVIECLFQQCREVVNRNDRREGRRNQRHNRDQGIDRRTSGVLERVANGITDDASLVGIRTLAAAFTGFDELLGVVPETAGVRHEESEDNANDNRAAEETGQTGRTEEETNDEREYDSDNCRPDERLERALRHE